MGYKRFRRGAEKTLALSFIMVFIVAILFIAIVFLSIGRATLMRLHRHKVAESGSKVIAEIETKVKGAYSLAETVALTYTHYHGNSEQLKLLLPKLFTMKYYRRFIAGGGVWPDTFSFTADSEHPPLFWGHDEHNRFRFFEGYSKSAKVDYHRTEWYLPVKLAPHREAYWSKVYRDPFSHQAMVTCSVPILDSGTFVGVSTVDVSLKELRTIFSHIIMPKDGYYMFAVDSFGTVFADPFRKHLNTTEFLSLKIVSKYYPAFHSLETVVNSMQHERLSSCDDSCRILAKQLEQSPDLSPREALIVARRISGPERTIKIRDSERFVEINQDDILGEPSLAMSFLMPDTGWVVVIVIPRSAIYPKAWWLAFRMFLLTAFIFFLVLLLGFFLIRRRLVLPLKHVVQYLQNESDGLTSFVPMKEGADDEIGELVHSLVSREQEIMLLHNEVRDRERRYRILFESFPDALFVISSDLVCIDCNAQGVALFRSSSKQDIVNHTLLEFLPPYQPDGSESEEMLSSLFSSEENGNKIPAVWHVSQRGGNGKPFPVSVRISLLTFDNTSFILIAMKDVSRQKLLEERLMHNQKIELIGTLSGKLMHDFNNILTGINGVVSLFRIKMEKKQCLDKKEIEENISVLSVLADRGASMVTQLMAISRLGNHQFSSELIVASDMMHRIVGMSRKMLHKSITIREFISDEPLLVEADPLFLEQALLNFCINAEQAMTVMKDAEWGGVLTLSLTLFEGDDVFFDAHPELKRGSYVAFAVQDTGVGIYPHHLPQIFDPFFTTKKESGGTGLGLAMVQTMVSSHGGAVDVQSVPGEGSTFTIYLPRYVER